ncbi:GntR family transcriptional regulator [Tenacibaculum aestuariivivum]|uniref:GntR family transcriptional regulator n=1 Tax=Tenacibaculum aestuariivivum TaxID=2006131 RepID=UPI003AB8E30F
MSFMIVEENNGIPKYKQIVKSIEDGILNGHYKRGDKLPSINRVKLRFSISRDTVLLAYGLLKSRGIIKSVPGKGYYVKSKNISASKKIFLLFDELNAFKEDLYNSFLSNLEEGDKVDIFFHHFNQNIFSKLIHDNIGIYNTYIIMPANLKKTHLTIDLLPKNNVYILDQVGKEHAKYAAIYQNFEKDILESLESGLKHLKPYNKLIFLFINNKQPSGMLKGFKQFCEKHQFDNEVIESFDDRKISKGEVYLIPDDRNLIRIIKMIKTANLELAKDIGIISYNDTLLKEVVEGGITTISTDFNAMGKRLAQMVTQKENIRIENPNNLILRNSI